MNNSLRSIIYFVITIAVLVISVKFFIFIVPYLLVAALVIFIYRKIRGAFNKKNEDKYRSNVEYREYKSESTVSDDDGKVIDVDYKEVK